MSTAPTRDRPTRTRLQASERAVLRVASVPATHVYVRRLAHPHVRRLQDPTGDDLRTPSFFDPAWLRAHADRFDLLHVHFGFEFYGADRLEAVCAELKRQRKPLVYTCHDLRNPNHAAPDVQDAALEVWMRHAAQVITLTPWAAAEIERRFGRHAAVLPHPHVVPMDVLRAHTRPEHADAFRIGLHFKSLRANMMGAPLLRAVLAALEDLPGVRLRVDLHCDVADPAAAQHDPDLVALAFDTVADAASPMDLHVHHYFSDDALWTYLASIDAFLLPYRFGTHSGLLEACRDLGTAVIAPRCGGYLDQGAQHGFTATDEDGLDVGSLHEALRAAVAEGPPPPLDPDARTRQRRDVAERHVRLYRDALASARS